MLTIKDLPELKLKISAAVEDFEIKNPFIPGQTNVNSYVSYLVTRLYCDFFKPDFSTLHNTRTNIDLNDVELINELWLVYRQISLKFGATCTIQRFCSFLGISGETLETWKNGDYRTGKHSESVKMFLTDSEADLIGRAVDSNSIGAIFALKAGFGYNDQQPQQINISRVDTPTLTQEEIKKQLSILSDD